MCAQQWLQLFMYADGVLAAAALFGKAVDASQWLWPAVPCDWAWWSGFGSANDALLLTLVCGTLVCMRLQKWLSGLRIACRR
jgi:hypothetical protein